MCNMTYSDSIVSFLVLCSEIFPYLIIVVGVENILVITKSVVSTPVDLEVKIRVAQGIALPESRLSDGLIG